MHRFYRLLMFFSCFPIWVNAQSNFIAGSIINLKGDSIAGFIDYQEWYQNPVSIRFKSSLADSSIQKFSAKDLNGFSISNYERFIRYTGPVSTDPVNINDMISYRDTSFKIDTVFLKVLQDGPKVKLMSYEDKIKVRYFIEENSGGIPSELAYKLYTGDVKKAANREAEYGTIDENTYIRQLYSLAQKYNTLTIKMKKLLEKADYSVDKLILIMNEINGNGSLNSQIKKSKIHSGHVFFAGVGFNNANFKVDNSPYSIDGGENYSSYQPALSGGIEIYPNSNTRRVVLRLELGLGLNKYFSQFNSKANPNLNITYKFNQEYIGLAPQILYNLFNGENFKLFAGLGIAINYLYYGKEQYGITNGESFLGNGIPYNAKTFTTKEQFKLGVLIDKIWEFSCNYTGKQPANEVQYFKLSYNSFLLSLNYHF